MTGDILQWFGIFLSLFLIYYGYRYQFSKAPLKEQLYSVYLPMFRVLEPYLYHDVNKIGIPKVKQIADQLNSIVDQHYELTHPSIVHWGKLLKERSNPEEYKLEEINNIYIHVCRYIDREFEKTRKKMFLPTRDKYYRINNKQYASKERMYFDLAVIVIPQLLALLGMGILANMVIKLIP